MDTTLLPCQWGSRVAYSICVFVQYFRYEKRINI
uniref:Uncharacterized protein n=1 Tax=Myoviridae sp. ctLnO19 TaxID=2825085 RepID=A0A8S5P0N2_9CAUD|nr:MAG TPA: hypothetical protein [Myoviridae sp. ctLnO19]